MSQLVPPTAALEVVILGGGYAGVLAASRVAGGLGRRARVTLVSDRDDLVDRVRLHEALAGRSLPRRPLPDLVPRAVRVVRGRAQEIDAARRRVVVDGRTLGYDALIVAVGSRQAVRVPGAREHAAWLASPEAAADGAARLAALPDGAPVVIVGGSLTAIEVATEIAESWPRLRVTMLAPQLGPSLSEPGRAYLRRVLDQLGVAVREGAVVDRVADDAVVVDGGERVPSRLTVWGGGFEPGGVDLATDLVRDARGRLVVDGDLRAAGRADVFVAGDAAAPPPGMDFLRMGCASAMPMAAHAADGVIARARGGAPTPHRFGFLIQCISLGRRRGLVQRVDARDRPLDTVWTGRIAAWVKELICRGVIAALRIERRWSGAFRWTRGVAALPDVTAAAPAPSPSHGP